MEGPDLLTKAHEELVTASQSFASFAQSFSGLLQLKDYVKHNEIQVLQASMMDSIRSQLEIATREMRAHNQMEAEAQTAARAELEERLEKKVNDRLVEINKAVSGDLSLLRSDVDILRTDVSGLRTEIMAQGKRIQKVVEAITDAGQGLLGAEAGTGGLDILLRRAFGEIAEGNARQKRLTLLVQDKAQRDDVLQLADQVRELQDNTTKIEKQGASTANKLSLLSRSVDEANTKFQRVVVYEPTGQGANTMVERTLPAEPVAAADTVRRRSVQIEGTADGAEQPVRQPLHRRRSVAPPTDWAEKFAETEDIKTLRERIEQYVGSFMEGKSQLADEVSELKNFIDSKAEKTDVESLQKTLAEQIALRQADGGRALNAEEVDRVVKLVQRRIEHEYRKPGGRSAGSIGGATTANDVVDEIDQMPEISNLNAQLHKVLVQMLVKADKADLDEITRRMEKSMVNVTRDGHSSVSNLRENIDKLHMMLNFKSDTAQVQARLQSDKGDLENRLKVLEQGMRSEQRALSKQMTRVLDKLQTAVAATAKGRDLSSLNNDSNMVYPSVINRALDHFTRCFACALTGRDFEFHPKMRHRHSTDAKEFTVLQPSQWPYGFSPSTLLSKQGHPVRSPSRTASKPPAEEPFPQTLLIGLDSKVYKGDLDALPPITRPISNTRPHTTTPRPEDQVLFV
eukprot:TRINITY_DN14599_c0_g1_i1.p1 TRINITY_DN14599_c0_g1~~TRINITY_DN14599_c0_g1_i1.p1  ORF type:complete len:684 (-),score=177.56 TRINITY_DN14599_c0_g1_i1:221-2272(-)